MKQRKFTLSFFSIIICVFCVGLTSAIAYSQSYDKVTVFKTQKKLKELGYNPGPLDGIWGKKTESALKRFQHDNSLSMTGKLDSVTRKKLGIILLEKSVPKQSIPDVSIQDGIREALEYTGEIKKVQIKNDILTVVPNFNLINKKEYASMIPWVCKEIRKYPNVSNQLKQIRILNVSQNQGWVLIQPKKCDQIIHAPLNQVDNLIFSGSAEVLIFESR
jgi:hypothetical protein